MADKNLRVNLIANTSGFKSAMSESSNQIRLLNSEFKNASAETDRYGNRVDTTGAKQKQLSGLIEQHKLRIQAIKNEQRHWTNELKKGNITEEQHAQKQRELASRLNNTEAQMKKYQGQLKRMNAEGKNARMTFEQFDRKFRDVGRTMRNVGMQVGITAGVGFTAMKRVLGDVVTEAMEFESGMSEVKAISGATGTEMEKLTKQAKDLGKQTKFTAQEAAESQAELARAGFEVSEIYDAMPGLLDLAASSNMELGSAAKITSNVLRGFNKDAKESGHVADVLAQGAATANTDVEGLGNSMQYVAPVAHSLGISFEEAAAATGLLADAGIDGSKAGRQLRQGMQRLAKPTGQAGDLMKELGLEVFDADGNMKSLDKVVGELEKGLEGQSKQAKQAALTTIFGSESTAGWNVLLEQGSDELKEYTTELENSDGAAEKMAETMMDNAEGAMVRMQSALSGLKIELGEKLLPILGDAADWVSELSNNFSEMDDATAETIAQSALLVTAVLGVTTVVGGLTAAIGALMAFTGPIGLAITGGTAALGLLAGAIYKNKLETEKAKEVNIDHADSLTNQASELENSANTFDKLSDKAKISNDELAQLYDLNQRIAEGGSSDEVAKLQSQYDKLADKSGLSKDELKELFGANENIIEQSPQVEQSISEQGNAFVESTDKAHEYIETLYEASRVELESEREKQLKRIDELQGELNNKQRQYNDAVEALELADEIRKMSQEEILDLQQDIVDKMNDTVQGSEEWHNQNEQLKVIQEALNGNADDHYFTQAEIVKEKRESVDATREELDELDAMTEGLADVRLKQAGITEEGEKGRIALEEKLVKNHEELAILDEQLDKNGQLTTKEQEKYDKLVEQNGELESAQQYMNEELELYGSVNSLVESKKNLLSENTQAKLEELEATHDIKLADGDIIDQLQEKQTKLVEERDQLEENRQKQGANKEEIDKQIEAIDDKIAKGDDAILTVLEELDALDLVKDGIQLNSQELQKFLEGLGYTTDEAKELAKVLVGDTISEMENGAERAGKAGQDTGKAHAQGVSSTTDTNIKSSDTIVRNTVRKLREGAQDAQTSGKGKGSAHSKGMSSTNRDNINSATNLKTSALDKLREGAQDAQNSGSSKGTAHSTGLSNTRGRNTSVASGLSNTVTSTLSRTTDGGGGSRAGSMFATGVSNRSGAARGAGTGVARSGESGLRSVNTSGAGSSFVSGFRNAISNGSVFNTAWNLGKQALRGLKSAIDSHSPSKETGNLGDDFGAGFNIAIDDQTKEAIKKSRQMGKESVSALSDEVSRYKQGFAQIATGIEQNKRSLVVEHTLDHRFNEMINAVNRQKEDNNPMDELLKATLEQNEQMMKMNQILMKMLRKDDDVTIDGNTLKKNIDHRLAAELRW